MVFRRRADLLQASDGIDKGDAKIPASSCSND
jgi:hypothetical protein